MAQNLVHHRFDLTSFHQAFQIADLKIGYADSTEFSLFIGIFQRFPCSTIAFYVTVITLIYFIPWLWMIIISR